MQVLWDEMKESGILIRAELNIDDGQPVNPIVKDAKEEKMNVMMPTTANPFEIFYQC
jgi:hypothetical protein